MRSIIYAITVGLIFVSRARSQTSFTAQRVASGLTQPLYVTAPPGDINHLFIVQKTGQIVVLDLRTGVVNRKPFFNIQRLLATTGEQGLLGMAFDPNYATNRKFYLNFTMPGGAFGNGVTHVSQFQVPVGKHRKRKFREKILLRFDHPQTNHDGGWIGFSPRAGDDNNLYIGTGDGGGMNDQGPGHIEPGGNAQSNTTLLGKILRVHVQSKLGRISIPSDNPFDILSIDYSCEGSGSGLMLVATMKVSGLAPVPAGVNWRVNFTANAPGGVSDRGDQFWLRANTVRPE